MHIVLASLGFPWWLGLEYYINLFFMGLLIRSGIQIVSAHLRFLYALSNYSTINEGQGGFREDYQYYGCGAEI